MVALPTILHLITTIERGGAEKALLSLAQAQSNFGYNVCVVPLKGKSDLLNEFQEAGVSVDLALIGKFLRPVKYLVTLRRILHSADIVHVHLPRAELMAAILLRPKSFISTRHNSEPFAPSMNSLSSRFLSRFVTNRSFRVICISHEVEMYIRSIKEIGPSTKSEVVHYGYTPVANQLRKSSRIDSPIRIGIVSRLVEQKNLSLLLHFAKKLRMCDFEFSLEILGQGPLLDNLRDLSSKLEIADLVTFCGVRSNPLAFISTVDFFVMTSKYEGFGLVLLEAIDCGVPILAPRHSVFPEVLGDKHPGLYAPNDIESMFTVFTTLVSDQCLRQNTIEYQFLRLELFSLEENLKKHNDIYSLFLESKECE